ncbi:MAG: DUF4058 family protein [Chloroflexi bacterium]|nr:DUF4058 family protein [Chloroflexota bacterium]
MLSRGRNQSGREWHSAILLPLAHALRTIYDEARCDLSINYGQVPVPPLAQDNATWGQSLLTFPESEST